MRNFIISLKVGDKAPSFNISVFGSKEFSLSNLKGSNVIIYFYPKDATPGCTKDTYEFRDEMPDFSSHNAKIIGISKDRIIKHDKFKAKYDLRFQLEADLGGAVCEAYGTWIEKSMYGRHYMGIERATFLVGKEGILQGKWRKVKGHVEEVLEAVEKI